MTDTSTGSRVGGLSPSQLAAFNTSAALTLFDLRVPSTDPPTLRTTRRVLEEEPLIKDSPIEVNVPVGSLAERFVTKAYGTLVSYLAELGVTMQAMLDEGLLKVSLISKETGNKLLEEATRKLVRDLEESLAKTEDPFEWKSLTECVVSECKSVLKAFHVCTPGEEPPADDWEMGVRSNFSKSKVEKIQTQPIIPSGLAMMEYGFSAGGEQILCPQPPLFTDEHWDLWKSHSPFPKERRHLDFVYAAAQWLPHEVLHCVQDMALGVTGAASQSALMNWQCEYCATAGQGLFLAAVIGENRKKGKDRVLQLPSHFLEESLLWLEACSQWRGSDESRQWGQDWSSSDQGRKAPKGAGDEQPADWMFDNHPEYLNILSANAIKSFKHWQAVVEKDEQETSYWAELIKFVNLLLTSTSPDAVAEVVAHCP